MAGASITPRRTHTSLRRPALACRTSPAAGSIGGSTGGTTGGTIGETVRGDDVECKGDGYGGTQVLGGSANRRRTAAVIIAPIAAGGKAKKDKKWSKIQKIKRR